MRSAIAAALTLIPPPGMELFVSDGITREMTPLAARCMRNEVMRHTLDLTGKRFGKLTAVAVIGETRGKLRWECRCDCGTRVFFLGQYLNHVTGPQSCGCARRENMRRIGKAQKGKHWKWSKVRKIRAKAA